MIPPYPISLFDVERGNMAALKGALSEEEYIWSTEGAHVCSR